MDLMEIRRRMLIANDRPRYLGTSDFSLQNVTVYQDSSKYQYLDIYLFKEEMPFTILMDCQVVYGYDSRGLISLDFLSGGDVAPANFRNGLGMRHYSTYWIDYLYKRGPYSANAANDYNAHKLIMRYDPTKNEKVKGWIDNQTNEATASFVQSDNPLWIGGSDHSANHKTGYGTINELMIYYRALDDADITNYINNRIIP